jgi:hypothetical protein
MLCFFKGMYMYPLAWSTENVLFRSAVNFHSKVLKHFKWSYSLDQGCQMVHFQKKIPICVHFGGPWIGKCWCIILPCGIFYGRLGFFIPIWYILCSFGTFCPVLVTCTKKNLATLLLVQRLRLRRLNTFAKTCFRWRSRKYFFKRMESFCKHWQYFKRKEMKHPSRLMRSFAK